MSYEELLAQIVKDAVLSFLSGPATSVDRIEFAPMEISFVAGRTRYSVLVVKDPVPQHAC